MKTLNITLTIAADTHDEAELRGKLDLMEFAKTVGMRSGSSIASCEGDTKDISSIMYEVNAKVQIDGNINVNEIIQEVQKTWQMKAHIIHSSIFVDESKKPEPVQKPVDYKPVTCAGCGQVMVKGYDNVVNPKTENEYSLCERCLVDAVDKDEVLFCECCESYIDSEDMVENPVTEEANLCPCCGNNVE